MDERMTSRDPRPDLAEDSALWEALLEVVHNHENEEGASALYWALDGLRCLGARLKRTKSGSLRLKAGDEMSEDEFQADCHKYLAPHIKLLSSLMREASMKESTPSPVAVRQTP